MFWIQMSDGLTIGLFYVEFRKKYCKKRQYVEKTALLLEKATSLNIHKKGKTTMTTKTEPLGQFTVRGASRQGVKHVRLNQNNQDALAYQSFSVPRFNKTYYVGLVSDGCSGHPGFSHSEVGAHLMSLYAYRRIQELICSKVSIESIPTVLYPSITEFLLDMMTKVMPPQVVWNYPIVLKDRENWSGQTRFRYDYLSATLIGFISDEETTVVFSAGDGVILVNDDLTIIDQDDHPDYPSISVNAPGSNFVVRVYKTSEINRLAVSTDGLEKLLQNLEFRNKLFDFRRGSALALQTLLNIETTKQPELMLDDCTVVTLEKSGERK